MGKQAAYGTRLRYVDPVSGITTIHNVADITGPEVSVETIDVTTHDSPDHFNEFLAGSADGGEVGFELVFDPDTAGHARIMSLIDARATIAFTLVLPKADATFIATGEFDAATGWTAGAEWAIDTGDGEATCTAATATGTTLAYTLAALGLGERYRVRIVTKATSAGEFEVSYDGDVIGTFTAAGAQTFDIYFRPGAATGDLEIAPVIGETVALILESVQVTGFLDEDDGQFEFDGVFTKAGNQFPVKDAIRASVSIKVSGKPVFVPAA